MVEGQTLSRMAAILTGVIIPVKDIATGQGNFLIGNLNVIAQANHGWQRKAKAQHGVAIFNLIRLLFNQQNNCALPTGNVQRFIGGVENQNSIHRTLGLSIGELSQ